MKERIRSFLDVGGDRRAGRWYGVLLAVGLLVLTYAIIYDWPSSSIAERVKRVVTLAMMGGLAVFYLKRPARGPRVPSDEPPA